MGEAAEKIEEVPKNNLFLEKLIGQRAFMCCNTNGETALWRINDIEVGRLTDERVFFKANMAGKLIGIFDREGSLSRLSYFQGDEVYQGKCISSGEDGVVRYFLEQSGRVEGLRKYYSGVLRF